MTSMTTPSRAFSGQKRGRYLDICTSYAGGHEPGSSIRISSKWVRTSWPAPFFKIGSWIIHIKFRKKEKIGKEKPSHIVPLVMKILILLISWCMICFAGTPWHETLVVRSHPIHFPLSFPELLFRHLTRTISPIANSPHHLVLRLWLRFGRVTKSERTGHLC